MDRGLALLYNVCQGTGTTVSSGLQVIQLTEDLLKDAQQQAPDQQEAAAPLPRQRCKTSSFAPVTVFDCTVNCNELRLCAVCTQDSTHKSLVTVVKNCSSHSANCNMNC